jgi:hypothetical protein
MLVLSCWFMRLNHFAVYLLPQFFTYYIRGIITRLDCGLDCSTSPPLFCVPLFSSTLDKIMRFYYVKMLIIFLNYFFRENSCSIPLRDRQVALQLLLEISIQRGSLLCVLQTVHLLLELWDVEESGQVILLKSSFLKLFLHLLDFFCLIRTIVLIIGVSRSLL